MEHHRGAVEQRDIGDRRVEEVAHLVADKLDEAVLVELRGERLGDAVDGDQFGGALADLVLALVDDQVGVGVVERDGGVGGEVFEQAEVLLGVGVLLEALNAEHAEHALLRDEREIDHGGRRLRAGCRLRAHRRCARSLGCTSRIRSSTSLIRIGWR